MFKIISRINIYKYRRENLNLYSNQTVNLKAKIEPNILTDLFYFTLLCRDWVVIGVGYILKYVTPRKLNLVRLMGQADFS